MGYFYESIFTDVAQNTNTLVVAFIPQSRIIFQLEMALFVRLSHYGRPFQTRQKVAKLDMYPVAVFYNYQYFRRCTNCHALTNC